MPDNHHPRKLPGRIVHRHRHWRDSLMAIMEPVAVEVSATEIDVGSRLRELRTARGLSIRALAEMSSLNFNTLSLIENDKSSPSVSTLQQLSMALGVPITAFFETASVVKDVLYQKSGQRPKAEFTHGLLEDLGCGLTLGEGVPLLLTLKPEADSGPNAISHTGQEFVYCLEGRLHYTVGDQVYILETGDSLIFEAHLPHRWENRSQTLSRSLLILCPADEKDLSAEQHFIPEKAAEQE
jgi:transcriptional regulator with XRE-family HTH domain